MPGRIRELIVRMNDSAIPGFLSFFFSVAFGCFNIRSFKQRYVIATINASIGMATYI